MKHHPGTEARYVFERDRNRFIAGRAFVRLTLSLDLDVRPIDIRLRYGARGKPDVDGSAGTPPIQLPREVTVV